MNIADALAYKERRRNVPPGLYNPRLLLAKGVGPREGQYASTFLQFHSSGNNILNNVNKTRFIYFFVFDLRFSDTETRMMDANSAMVGANSGIAPGNPPARSPVTIPVGMPSHDSSLNAELERHVQHLAASLELPQSVRLATNVAPTSQSEAATVEVLSVPNSVPVTSSCSLVGRHGVDSSMVPCSANSSQKQNHRRISCMSKKYFKNSKT